MEREIVSFLKGKFSSYAYRGLSLVEQSDYELRFTDPSNLMISPLFNFFKNIKIKLRSMLSKPSPNNKGKILFLVYTNSHVNTILPIIKKLGDKALVVKRDGFTSNIAKKLRNKKIEYNDIEGYITKESLTRINKAEKILKKKFNEVSFKNKSNKETLRYIFLTYFIDVIRCIELVNNITSFEKPRIIVVMNDVTTLGKVAVSVAKKRGVKTLCIQHGAMSNNPISFIPVSADKIAVWGENSKKALVSRGTPKNKIIITGATHFDNINKSEKEMTKDIANEIGIDLSKKYILITTQTFPKNSTRKFPNMGKAVRSVCDAVKLIPELQIVIKTHPAEYSIKKYKDIIKKSGVNGFLTKKHLYPLIKGCSALITISSGTGFEAFIMGKPLIIINLDNYSRIPYSGSNAVIEVKKAENLRNVIQSVIEKEDLRKKLAKNAEKFLYKTCYKTDKKTSDRVISLIRNIINN